MRARNRKPSSAKPATGAKKSAVDAILQKEIKGLTKAQRLEMAGIYERWARTIREQASKRSELETLLIRAGLSLEEAAVTAKRSGAARAKQVALLSHCLAIIKGDYQKAGLQIAAHDASDHLPAAPARLFWN